MNGAGNLAASSPANPQGKNMDAIPGLAYFAKAADILGELPGGSDISHVQANLLAGLYMGQLARIIPSYYYINKACNAVQILIESTAYVQGTMNPSRRNLINFAFWSALQLESDIAAEFSLPPSGITRYESAQHKNMPTGITLDTEVVQTEDLLRFYSYQIQLRTTMNSVHSSLYRVSKEQSQASRPTPSIVESLDQNLDNWRKMLNDWSWDEDDWESPSINIARMRGKYYGGKYIIWRPVLQYALSIAASGSKQEGTMESPAGNDRSMASPSTVRVPYLSDFVLHGAKTCVEAAIRSTTCFDKCRRRLIVTNIFGTAHA
jgi:hypothetical protein